MTFRSAGNSIKPNMLSPIYEKQFSTHSYGFMPKRNAHQALNKYKDYITEGYKYAVDMDLEKFFDTVNQNKLIELMSRTLTSTVNFIENKLSLKVNREKTVVAYISKIKFLGYSFCVKKVEGRLRVHAKSLAKMKKSG
ncbi:reverse transcriptase domain-containing protein [Mariniflexile sp.]|uniref:reverse transcriptase domain-containing protein n=1 Tax=Mariniflexile sp. TaxID=1979402 RepID=UPI004048D95F